MTDYFLGGNAITQNDLLGGQPRYFYGLRRTDQGDLYFVRIDQLEQSDTITINNPGPTSGNYDQFEFGTDFFEGRDVNHNLVYSNLTYEQYRWDNRSMYYYIDSNGELTAVIGQVHTYPSAGNV